MSRLSDLKTEAAKGTSRSLPARGLDPQTLVAVARRMQSQAIGHAGRAAIGGLIRLCGLDALAQTISESVGRWRSRRRTALELDRLDDRMLSDIGLTRADIDRVAIRVSNKGQAGPSFLKRLAIRTKGYRARRDTIRDLNQLSDSALADIGLGRDDIRYVADRLSALHVALALRGHIDMDRPLSATARDARMVANSVRKRRSEPAATGGLVGVLSDIDWLSEAIVNRTPREANNRNVSVDRAA